ncbi:glycerol-3-phosphate dehydrogenase/oxidase [Dethiosulfatarculus sandiegensis]|uniref:3-keto-disaccharide hydrolase domain-containing protein n=1 Tax=Dethiosulfatarculus sandiegensis TaxID=1429043 RepID=A0A0D2JG28_9BACT|nr:glycerol-3-phosphate dehydrogenase/oxidase [Dethiosulfatarculus sandiegensis]KIX14676.1 hypothetical protein X474_08500 [Dethiosulfatarculus sandiegensis]
MKKSIVLVFLLFSALVFSTSVALAQEVIQSFSGNGSKNTRPFTVQDGWEIQWDARGAIFQVFLHNANGEMVGVPANQQGAGKGASYQAKGGKYYLMVNAVGPWKVKLVNLSKQASAPKTKPKPGYIASFKGNGAKTTRPFEAPNGWEIQWDARGAVFQVFLHNANGEMAGVPANQQGAGKGASYQAKGGKYYLMVNAMGAWRIKIVKVD